MGLRADIVQRRVQVAEHNIHCVVRTGVCTGCGMCAALCPTHAISMCITQRGLWEPCIESRLCMDCGYCLEVCGRHNVGHEPLEAALVGAENFHQLLGRFRATFRGHASDEHMRWAATSGGLATVLLTMGFELGWIDAVIVTAADPMDPTVTKPFVACSVEQVLQARGARYAPSPVNSCVREAQQYDRVAVVGLPCHIVSLRKAEGISKELRRKIVLHLGLFCSHTVSLFGTEFVYRCLKIDRDRIADFRYRGDGWPSGIHIRTSNGHEVQLPNQGSLWTQMFMSFIFAAPYCLRCIDHTAELADLSLGDAWLPEVLASDRLGESVVIVRSVTGSQWLDAALKSGRLHVEELAVQRVIESQRWPLYFKKQVIPNLHASLANRRLNVAGELAPGTRTDRRLAWWAWLNAICSCHPWMPRLLSMVPRRIFRFYCGRFYRLLWQGCSNWGKDGIDGPDSDR